MASDQTWRLIYIIILLIKVSETCVTNFLVKLQKYIIPTPLYSWADFFSVLGWIVLGKTTDHCHQGLGIVGLQQDLGGW